MNEIEKYCDRELNEMQCICTYISHNFIGENTKMMGDIYKIALVEINRELDKRKIRGEGRA